MGDLTCRRQSAAALGRIYPYRAAKQQAPGVAADDGKGFPNRSGMTGRGTIRPPVAVSVFEAGAELIDY